MTLRATTILNEAGDTTITWTEEQDEAMEEVIRRKMAQGITFFIVEPRAFGLLPPKRTALGDAAEARKHRALAIPDADFARFVEAGQGEAVKTPDGPVRGSRRSKDAKEVAQNQSVGVRPMRGG